MMFNEAAGKEDVVHLSIGQPDFDTPAPVIEAMVQALHEGKTRYALDSGVPEFREAIGGYYERTQGVQVHPEEVLVTDGAVEAITLTLQAFISPGDEVILLEPAFVVYAPFIQMIGGVPVSVVTRVEDGYIPDPGEVEAAITPRTRMILVNSPCNPTGSTYPVEVLRELAAVARRHGLLLGSDEVYEQLVYDHEGNYPSMLTLEPDRDRLFVFHSLSKTYAMTGIRVGWVVTGHSNWRLLQKLHTFTTTVANTPGQWAGIEALTGDQSFIPPWFPSTGNGATWPWTCFETYRISPATRPEGPSTSFPGTIWTWTRIHFACVSWRRRESVAFPEPVSAIPAAGPSEFHTRWVRTPSGRDSGGYDNGLPDSDHQPEGDHLTIQHPGVHRHGGAGLRQS